MIAILTGCSSSGSASAPSTGSPAPSTTVSAPPSDVPSSAGHPTLWLCRPGMPHNPCAGGLGTVVVDADGTARRQPFVPARNPKVDCFYVYPTVSRAPGDLAPLRSAPEIVATARAQAARFAADCRLFVPVYRQLTTKSITDGSFFDAHNSAIAYGDVRAAWADYLAHDNHGRGVVLIGHSQGSFVLRKLIQQDIDNDPAHRRLLVSAVLLGGNISVPKGKQVGGDFSNIPACHRADQTGCVVAYSSFATTPPSLSLFGRASAGNQIVCVDPTALLHERGALHPLIPTARLVGSGLPGLGAPDIPGGGFVEPLGRVRAHCSNDGGASVLRVSGALEGKPVRTLQTLGPAWGLHTADVNIALGDLVRLVGRQVAAWHG